MAASEAAWRARTPLLPGWLLLTTGIVGMIGVAMFFWIVRSYRSGSGVGGGLLACGIITLVVELSLLGVFLRFRDWVWAMAGVALIVVIAAAGLAVIF